MKSRLILAALLVLAAALPVMSAETRIDIDVSNRPYLGPKDAPVTIIEFLDFQ
jgi:hypothetical protein